MPGKQFCSFGRVACLLGVFNLASLLLSADEIQKPVSRQGGGENSVKDRDLPPPGRDVRQAVGKAVAAYRSTRATSKERVAALKQLAALGDEGVAAAKDLLDKEIQQAETVIGLSKKPSNLDAKIEKLRKTLADLRHDPDLSKDQLHTVGLPTVEELTVAYRQRAKAMAAQSTKYARVAESLRLMIAVLQTLQEQGFCDAPLLIRDYLQKAQAKLIELAPPEGPAQAILAKNKAMASKFPSDIREGMNGVNALRMTCGLPPLLFDAKLCEAAHGHSKDMLTRGFFAHESPVEGKKTPWDRARLAGTTASGENIYMGSSAPADALKTWFLSPPHHKNLFSESARRQGLGHEGTYWTQMLGAGEADGK